jgi:hypothetical protein
VVVNAGVAVEPGLPGVAADGAGQLLDDPLVHQEPKVAVDGAEAHTGKAAADPPIDPLGGGMKVGAPDQFQDQPARLGEPEAPAAEGLGIQDPYAIFRNDSHYEK